MMANLRAHLDHPYVNENLSAYLDNEVEARDRVRIERHLTVCDECQQQLASLRQMVMLLHSTPVRPLPRSFTLPRSVQPVQARHRRWSLAFGYMRTAAVAVTFMIALLISGDVLLSSGAIPLQARTAAQPQVMSQSPVEKAVEETVVVEKEKAAEKQMEKAAAPPPAPEQQTAPQVDQAPAPKQPAIVEQQEAPVEAAPTAAALAPESAPPDSGAGDRSPAPGPVVPKPSGVQPEFGVGGGGPPGMGGGGPEARGMGGGGPVDAQGEQPPLAQASPVEEGKLEGQGDQPLALTAPTGEPPTEAPAARAAAPAATSAPLPTPTEAPAVAQVEAYHAEPEGSSAADTALLEQPRPALWALWRAVRLAWAALLGILLMLVAGVLWAGQKRRM